MAGTTTQAIEHRLQKSMQRRFSRFVMTIDNVHSFIKADGKVMKLSKAINMYIDKTHLHALLF